MAPRKNAGRTTGAQQTEKKRERKQYAAVSLDMLKPEPVTKEEKVTVLPGRERSDEQKAVDKAVSDLAYKYLDAGSPKQFRDMPAIKYTLPPAQAETVRFMLGKACNLLNCKPKFGRAAWDGEGNEVVTFAAIPRDPSQWKDNHDAVKSEEDATKSEPENADKSEPGTEGESRTDPSDFLEE